MTEQVLEQITHACVLGLITGRRGPQSEHAQCTNRACECFCHKPNSIVYKHSWKRGAA